MVFLRKTENENRKQYDNLFLQTTWGEPISTGQPECQSINNTFMP